jgi:hypothetical protein
MNVMMLAVLVLGLTGCGTYHWTSLGTRNGRPVLDLAEFTKDHRTCAHEAAVSVGTTPPGHGIIQQTFFRACMMRLGWRRALPPGAIIPAGWFRGVEDDDIVVSLDAIPAQPNAAR